MATLLFTEQDNGNLKLVAEVDENNPALALDELLDEYPRLAGEEFVALSTEAIVKVASDGNEIVQPRRSIRVVGGTNGSAAVADVDTADDEAAAPVARKRRSSGKKRRGRPAGKARKTAAKKRGGKKRKAAATPAKKRSGAKKRTTARKAAPKKGGNPLAKKGGGGFRSNPASAE